jgi:hypothetical protein
MSTRNWHQGKVERRTAFEIKKRAKSGTLSYEKAAEVLTILGWTKVQDERWLKS